MGHADTKQEEELIERTKELLEDNAEQVMQLMIQYAQSSRTYPALPVIPLLILSVLSYRCHEPASSRLHYLMATRNPRRQSRRVAFDGRDSQGIG